MGTGGLARPPCVDRAAGLRPGGWVQGFVFSLHVSESGKPPVEENTATHQLSQEAPGKSADESMRRAETLENTTPNTAALSQQKWEWEGDAADGSKVGQINQSHETLANSAALAGMCVISLRSFFSQILSD